MQACGCNCRRYCMGSFNTKNSQLSKCAPWSKLLVSPRKLVSFLGHFVSPRLSLPNKPQTTRKFDQALESCCGEICFDAQFCSEQPSLSLLDVQPARQTCEALYPIFTIASDPPTNMEVHKALCKRKAVFHRLKNFHVSRWEGNMFGYCSVCSLFPKRSSHAKDRL